jgi:hypothetical protein
MNDCAHRSTRRAAQESARKKQNSHPASRGAVAMLSAGNKLNTDCIQTRFSIKFIAFTIHGLNWRASENFVKSGSVTTCYKNMSNDKELA